MVPSLSSTPIVAAQEIYVLNRDPVLKKAAAAAKRHGLKGVDQGVYEVIRVWTRVWTRECTR